MGRSVWILTSLAVFTLSLANTLPVFSEHLWGLRSALPAEEGRLNLLE